MGNEPQSIYELFLVPIHFKEFVFPKIKKLQHCLIKNTASKHVKKSCNHTERAKKVTSKMGAASLCPLLTSGTRIILLHGSFCTLLKEFVPELQSFKEINAYP